MRFRLESLYSRIADGQSAATAIEYGLMVGLIALALVPALDLVAAGLNKTFNALAAQV